MPTNETLFVRSSSDATKLNLCALDDLSYAWNASNIEAIVPALLSRLPTAMSSPARDFYVAGMHSVIHLILSAQVEAFEALSEDALKRYLTEPASLLVLKEKLSSDSPVRIELMRFLESFTWRMPKGYLFDSYRYSEIIGPMVMLLSLSNRDATGASSGELFVV